MTTVAHTWVIEVSPGSVVLEPALADYAGELIGSVENQAAGWLARPADGSAPMALDDRDAAIRWLARRAAGPASVSAPPVIPHEEKDD